MLWLNPAPSAESQPALAATTIRGFARERRLVRARLQSAGEGLTSSPPDLRCYHRAAARLPKVRAPPVCRRSAYAPSQLPWAQPPPASVPPADSSRSRLWRGAAPPCGLEGS